MQMAAEVLYSMLARDRNVRQAYAEAGALPNHIQLLQVRIYTMY